MSHIPKWKKMESITNCPVKNVDGQIQKQLDYEKIYIKQNPKRFSKNWFINRKIKKRYNKLYRIFSVSKPGYITKISSDMGELNRFKEGVLNDFIETKKIIENLTKQTLTFTKKPTRSDVIKINAMMIDSIYLNNRLQYLSEELDKFKS